MPRPSDRWWSGRLKGEKNGSIKTANKEAVMAESPETE